MSRVPIGRGEDNLRPLYVFARPIAVRRNRCQLVALRGAHYHIYPLRHELSPNVTASIAHSDGLVNLLTEPKH